MNLAEVRVVLERALPVRIPQLDPSAHPRDKVQALSDHILLVAHHRAELEEALHWCLEAGKRLRSQWDGLQGYEVSLPGGGRTSRTTKEQVEQAKRELAPNTYAGLEEARLLVGSLKAQIARMGGSDYDAASRVYTMMSGS